MCAPGYDVDTEGDGRHLRVTRKPQNGHRTRDHGRRRPMPKLIVIPETMDALSAVVHGAASTGIIRRRWRSRSTTGPTRSGRRRSWTF